jgi:hypothetical protein
MSIEINGVVYNKEDLQSHIDRYVSYLQGLSGGLYSSEQGEVQLLELTDNKSVEDVISKLQSFSQVAEDLANFDFNASGTSDANDIELLKSIIEKNTQTGGLEIRDVNANHKEVITAGGFKIRSNSNAQTILIYRPDGSLMTKIWGDPHVNEYNEEGQHTGTWHYADDSMFILPDGTELVMNSTVWGNANENIMVNRGIYVRNGDDVAAFGLEFGEGRNNAASDQEEGATSALRMLDIDADEWDAAVQDFNSSGNRNGVFAHVNGQWARRADDGNFYDLQNETWAAYRGRQGNELFTEGEAVSLNRDQLISALDGQDVLTLRDLRELNLGSAETFVVNKFLEDPSKFNDRVVQQIGLLVELGVSNEELVNIVDGGATHRQGEFLNKVLTLIEGKSNGAALNADVKDAILDHYFSMNNRIEREPKLNNSALTETVLNLINFEVNENNPYSEFANQVFENSLFADSEIDIKKINEQLFFLEKTNRKRDFIYNNAEISEAMDNFLASKFFDVDEDLVLAAQELLSENTEKYIDLINLVFKVAAVDGHSYEDQFEELLDKVLDQNLARAVHEDDFSIVGGSSTHAGGTIVISSRYRGSNGRTGNLLRIVDQFINSPEPNFAAFVEKTEMILGLQDERDAEAEVIEQNAEVIETIANLRLEGLRSEKSILEAELSSLEGSNSRYDQRRRRDINRSLRRIENEISSVISALS